VAKGARGQSSSFDVVNELIDVARMSEIWWTGSSNAIQIVDAKKGERHVGGVLLGRAGVEETRSDSSEARWRLFKARSRTQCGRWRLAAGKKAFFPQEHADCFLCSGIGLTARF